jgi:hypothetical protein
MSRTPPTRPLASPPPLPFGHTADSIVTAGDLASRDVPCLRCGYNLRGLAPDGACPECGTPVARSLRGNLLRYSDPAYVARIHTGVFIIQAVIIVQILLVVAALTLALAAAFGGARGAGRFAGGQVLLPRVQIALHTATFTGWWMFSAPDTAYLGRDAGDQARRVVRIAVGAGIAVAVVQTALALLLGSGALGATSGAAFVILATSLLGTLAWVVQFFAAMLYLRWLAPRLPSMDVHTRASRLLWLGPLLYTVGLLLAGLGPLIALVLYWTLLDEVRKLIKRVRGDQSLESAAGVMPG